uniref:Uncharacterized protein n=1 Tax=viral metagenome TaxID=1070528 RepID=A0A6C0JLJ9_9ZZZZ
MGYLNQTKSKTMKKEPDCLVLFGQILWETLLIPFYEIEAIYLRARKKTQS